MRDAVRDCDPAPHRPQRHLKAFDHLTDAKSTDEPGTMMVGRMLLSQVT